MTVSTIVGSYTPTNWYWADSTSTSTVLTTSSSTSTAFTTAYLRNIISSYLPSVISLPDGSEYTVILPGGSVVLSINKDGSYELKDSGIVKYRGCRIKEFNRFINASDLIEEFIRFMGKSFNIRQSDVLGIPIELFINWLIIKSCEEDKEAIPLDVPKLEDHHYIKGKDRCLFCGRFIPKKYVQSGINFCGPLCVDRMIQKKTFTASL